MKYFILFFLSLFIILGINAQTPESTYDSTLAKSLGADEYGMKQYVFVILKTGPAQISDPAKRDSLFAGHMANIKRLAAAGQLYVAGPFMKNDQSFRGLFILNTNSKDEAMKMLSADPTIREKIFDVELFDWYGSAALGEYLKLVPRITKTKF
jgi:uncharacterized protein